MTDTITQAPVGEPLRIDPYGGAGQSQHLYDSWRAHLRDRDEKTPDRLKAAFVAGYVAARNLFPTFSVYRMKTSAGTDYFVSMKTRVGEETLFRLKHRFQAEYTKDELIYLTQGGKKPFILFYDEKNYPDFKDNEDDN